MLPPVIFGFSRNCGNGADERGGELEISESSSSITAKESGYGSA